ncbi:hypothetical protein [Streptomyces sp. NBC_00503]|uniref:hypothetical protein n=1 Tax=Streptomyces sp. NBC_00503 TaxID=2903659 RepID=UPI002E81ABB0|nr:hypothetical protein [Streptomyces sp. NBC_00503]WUD86296.1 hypothetical protein OG490_32000 [Streptomyces sp. NBC_00503]
MRTASALFRTYETVARDTPASRATSALVGTDGGVVGFGTDGVGAGVVGAAGAGACDSGGFGGFDD